MDFIHVTLRFSDKKFSKNRIMLSSQSLHENGWCTLLSEACIGNPMGLPMGGVSVQFTYTKQGQIKRLRLLRATKSQELNDAAIQTIIRASASFPKVNQDFTLRLPIVFKLID